MSCWKEGDKKNFLFVLILSMLLVTSTILLSTFTSIYTDEYSIYEKSTVPKSNDPLVNTTLEVLVNSNIIQQGHTINSHFDEVLNVTVFYKDNITHSHLTGAVVDLLGLGGFDEIGTQYNFSIHTNNLLKGFNILTIDAQLDGYQSQTIHFFINIVERATELLLYVNGIQVYQSATVQFDMNELINITVFYKDNVTGTHLSGASVELLGINHLDENGLQYNITVNSAQLGEGTHLLTIFAQLDGYQPQSFQFLVDVVEKAANIQLFVNAVDKTADPAIELPIGTLINITVKYYDNRTGLEIPNALVLLIGEGPVENLTENSILKQYTIVLNSSNLYIGVKLFTIVAQAPNYEMNSINLRITVRPIRVEISGNSIISVLVGEVIHVEVELTDLDFGGPIIGATVVYKWQFGQGVLTDLNSDGIYDANLTSTMAGIYTLNIFAYNGENYDFELFQTTIVITNPLVFFILSSDAGNPDTDGTFSLLWISLEHADYYLIYFYNRNITQINSSVIFLGVQTDNSPYLISGLPDGIYYYIVVAFNDYGNYSSNCIQIIVLHGVDEVSIPGYNLFTLIGIISIFTVSIIHIQLKQKNKISKRSLRHDH